MFITKKSLSRRTILQGLGVSLALPLLDSMVPALTAAPAPVRRFGAIMVPLGERPGYWNPPTPGPNFEFSPILKPIERFRDSLTVVSNLCDPVSGHAITVAAWLSGSNPFRTIAENVKCGKTIDQFIADKIGQDSALRSLELATEDFTGYIGSCDAAYSCVYSNTISWHDETTPVPMEINPRLAFERIFGTAGTSAQRSQRMKTERSILDSVLADANDLERGLGGSDRRRISDYLDSVRDVEKRIQAAESHNSSNVAVPDAPIGIPEEFEEHAMLMYDLAALALEADITRVFTFMKARDGSQRVYPNIGLTEPHHSMSHHSHNPAKIAGLVKLNTYHVELFGRFLDKLQSTPDGDGTLLDHCLILYGCGMSESDTHLRTDIPTLLAGSGAGLVKGNRFIEAPKETPIANLHLDLANKFGGEGKLDHYGISTGRFTI